MNDLIISQGKNVYDKQYYVSYVEIINEFSSRKVTPNNSKIYIDNKTGKISFRTPIGYFHDFIQDTVMNSMEARCMEDANYIMYIYINNMYNKERYRLKLSDPKMLSCNNYGREEGHELLLQATNGEIEIERIINEPKEEQTRDVCCRKIGTDLSLLTSNNC